MEKSFYAPIDYKAAKKNILPNLDWWVGLGPLVLKALLPRYTSFTVRGASVSCMVKLLWANRYHKTGCV